MIMLNNNVLVLTCICFVQSKLFEGLEEDSGLSPDTFVPRKNIKKLVIKNKSVSEVCAESSYIKIQYYVWCRCLDLGNPKTTAASD